MIESYKYTNIWKQLKDINNKTYITLSCINTDTTKKKNLPSLLNDIMKGIGLYTPII